MNILKSTRTLFCTAGLLLTAMLTACGGGDQGRDPILGLPTLDVVSVSVTPATATVQITGTQQYTATANYADGSAHVVTTTSAWTSGSPLVASVGAATGLATGLTVGSSAISASFGGKTGTANFSVTAPTLSSISVTPATPSIVTGTTQQFVATGNYSNGTTAVIAVPVWASATPATATINAAGLASGLIPGTSIISATSAGITGNAVLTVTAVPPAIPVPPPVVPPLPTTVNLGTASSFAVLAGTSLTNNSGGLTLVTGDVGSPSQTVDPVQTPGWANYKSGPILAQALADLQTAISTTNQRACTSSSAAGIDLGGKIYGPGVYCFGGAITMTGTFIMDGPGVYIFRTTSTLDTSANAIVAVAGGATASEVFWLPTGPTTLGANGAFLGSILAQSAAITVGDNTTLLGGRVLSAAAVTLRNNVIVK